MSPQQRRLSAREAAQQRASSSSTPSRASARSTTQASSVSPPEGAEVACRDLFAPVMASLLDCANVALTDCQRPVGRAQLVVGEVAHDDCCEGSGQLSVRLIDAFPSGRPFPQADMVQPCGITVLAARIGVGVVRCAHVLTDDGDPPTPEEITADALGATADASILLSAIQCCDLSGTYTEIERVVRWVSTGAQGGCLGGEWELLVGLNGCGCG